MNQGRSSLGRNVPIVDVPKPPANVPIVDVPKPPRFFDNVHKARKLSQGRRKDPVGGKSRRRRNTRKYKNTRRR